MTHFPAYFNAFASYKNWCFAPHWRGPPEVQSESWKWASAHGCGLNHLALHALSCFEYLDDLYSTSGRAGLTFRMLIRCYFNCCLHCAYTTVLCDESSRLIYWNVNFGHEYSRDGNWFFIMTHFPAHFNAFASYKSWCFAQHWRGPRKFSQIFESEQALMDVD